ncbi:hypothetical protein J8273_3961 [Carpediemonas membranifera]|uniref:Uncharacterized protein n=1 Tax=Carpediemonas membranifera TaxID=201153 RepID=A0A8J6E4D9_9EUKA|nr:hypothetical protein J8273_3961 [Carpediemonas membranifera]|eukprot:KAG9394327.1 hypothetical protein J8273_3961 [Carpediemonas membranifera]
MSKTGSKDSASKPVRASRTYSDIHAFISPVLPSITKEILSTLISRAEMKVILDHAGIATPKSIQKPDLTERVLSLCRAGLPPPVLLEDAETDAEDAEPVTAPAPVAGSGTNLFSSTVWTRWSPLRPPTAAPRRAPSPAPVTEDGPCVQPQPPIQPRPAGLPSNFDAFKPVPKPAPKPAAPPAPSPRQVRKKKAPERRMVTRRSDARPSPELSPSTGRRRGFKPFPATPLSLAVDRRPLFEGARVYLLVEPFSTFVTATPSQVRATTLAQAHIRPGHWKVPGVVASVGQTTVTVDLDAACMVGATRFVLDALPRSTLDTPEFLLERAVVNAAFPRPGNWAAVPFATDAPGGRPTVSVDGQHFMFEAVIVACPPLPNPRFPGSRVNSVGALWPVQRDDGWVIPADQDVIPLSPWELVPVAEGCNREFVPLTRTGRPSKRAESFGLEQAAIGRRLDVPGLRGLAASAILAHPCALLFEDDDDLEWVGSRGLRALLPEAEDPVSASVEVLGRVVVQGTVGEYEHHAARVLEQWALAVGKHYGLGMTA